MLNVLDLAPGQFAILEQLALRGFTIASFPLYGNAVGVRRGDCAALLAPAPNASFALLGEPGYLLKGNLAVAVIRGGRKLYAWKKDSIEATEQREEELRRFREDLLAILDPSRPDVPARPPSQPA